MKGTTDENTNKFLNTCDGLGRPTLIQQPDPSATATLLTKTAYAYNDVTSSVSVRQTDYLDSSTTVDTYTYYDGLKRVKQARKSAEGGNFETKDLAYNNIGLLQQESLPYFSASSANTSATTASALFTTYSYDALQRIKSAANVLGTTTKAYVNWKVIVTDPNGNKKDLKYDAYGNLIEVDEHHNAGGGMGGLMPNLDSGRGGDIFYTQLLAALGDESVSPDATPDISSPSPEPSASLEPGLASGEGEMDDSAEGSGVISNGERAGSGESEGSSNIQSYL